VRRCRGFPRDIAVVAHFERLVVTFFALTLFRDVRHRVEQARAVARPAEFIDVVLGVAHLRCLAAVHGEQVDLATPVFVCVHEGEVASGRRPPRLVHLGSVRRHISLNAGGDIDEDERAVEPVVLVIRPVRDHRRRACVGREREARQTHLESQIVDGKGAGLGPRATAAAIAPTTRVPFRTSVGVGRRRGWHVFMAIHCSLVQGREPQQLVSAAARCVCALPCCPGPSRRRSC
jgi:hypothetical protein